MREESEPAPLALMEFDLPSSESDDEFITGPNPEKQAAADMLAEYTDDDTVDSSDEEWKRPNHRLAQDDPARPRFIRSVHATLRELHEETKAMLLATTHSHAVDPKGDASAASSTSWLFQQPVDGVALNSTSLFVFPVGMTLRTVLFNLFHHWVFEVFLMVIIAANAVFQANWVRSSPTSLRPPYATWVDVFFMSVYLMEAIGRIVALGLFAHSGAYLRDVWHWLDVVVLVLGGLNLHQQDSFGNFTSIRLLRIIKSLSLVKQPIGLKLFAKTFLRSLRSILHVLGIVGVAYLFFGLIGHQIFSGALRFRCAQPLLSTPNVTFVSPIRLCNPHNPSSALWGQGCQADEICAEYPVNPNYGFWQWDDIGHAILAVFQVSTFQDWTGMLRQTTATVNTISFLYYWCVLTTCAWFLPGLILGIFMERGDKTREEYVAAHVERYENICKEKRFEAIRAAKLTTAAVAVPPGDHSAVVVDVGSALVVVPPQPSHGAAQPLSSASPSPASCPSSAVQRLESVIIPRPQTSAASHGAAPANAEAVWSEEMRLQLHLSLTRNRSVAEEAEMEHRSRTSRSASRLRPPHSRPGTPATDAAESRPTSAVSRLDAKAKEVAFLEPSARRSSSARRVTSASRSVPATQRDPSAQQQQKQPRSVVVDDDRMLSMPGRDASANPLATLAIPAEIKRPSTAERLTPLGDINTADEPPLKRDAARALSRGGGGGDGDEPLQFTAIHDGEPEPLKPVSTATAAAADGGLIYLPDPEGGDLSDETADWPKRWEMVRAMVHMLTEGYPRIISRYLYDCRRAKRKGYLDMGFESIYEQMARDAMNEHKKAHVRSAQEQYELEEALKITPYRMASNIADNAPSTWFHYVMVGTLAINSVVLATYHYPQSQAWLTAQWVVHFAASLCYLGEVLLRVVALGPTIFFTNLMNIIDVVVVLVGFVELGFNQTNAITCLRIYRVMSQLRKFRRFRSLRKVSRVLWFCLTDLLYLALFFVLYLLLVAVYGMNLFGGDWTTGSALNPSQVVIDAKNYSTRGNYNTFSDAAYASVQAFSRTRDDWLLLSWSAMSQKGEYTVIYSVLSVLVAVFVFQPLFVAILAEGFERDDEHDSEDDEVTLESRGIHRYFDFGRLAKMNTLTGGFTRRPVAALDVFDLRADMRHRLATAEHDLNRFALSAPLEASRASGGARTSLRPSMDSAQHAAVTGKQGEPHTTRLQLPLDPPPVAQPTTSSPHQPADRSPSKPDSPQSPIADASSGRGKPVPSRRRSSLYYRNELQVPALHESVDVVMTPTTAAAAAAAEVPPSKPADGDEVTRLTRHVHYASLVYADAQRIKVSGPSYALARVRGESGQWMPDRCDACGDVKVVPLPTPRTTLPKTVDQLHTEHCTAASVRLAKTQVLHTILEYVNLQQELGILPTRQCLETLLGQAWSCGMLLSESLDQLCGIDPATERRTWKWLLEAVETQQWLLSLRVGEEQIGRATHALLVASKQEALDESETNVDYSLFVFRPTHPVRSLALDVVHSRWFAAITLALIVINSVVLAVYDRTSSSTTSRNRALWIMDDILSLLFLAEILVKGIAHGFVTPVPKALLCSPFHAFDAFVVAAALASWAVDSLGLRYLKAFRVFHVLGALQGFEWSRDMRVLSVAMQDGMRGFASATVFALINYFAWTVFSLHLFAGKAYACNDSNRTTKGSCTGTFLLNTSTAHLVERTVANVTENVTITNFTLVNTTRQWYSTTNRTFDDFGSSLLVMLEVSTGSWWLEILYQATDSYAVDHASVLYHQRYLGLFFVAFYIIAGFIVFGLFASLMVYSYVKAKSLVGGSSQASSPEQLRWLRIQRYLLQLRPSVLLGPLGLPLCATLHEIATSRWTELVMSLVVVGNIVTMAVDSYGHTERNQQALNAEYVWVAMFIGETLLRFCAHGPLRTLRHSAHRFDACMVALSIVQLGLNSTAIHKIPFDVNVLRMLRVFRVAHAVRFIPQVKHVRMYGDALWYAVPSLVTVTLVFCVCVYVFAIVGMHAFGGIPTDGLSYLDATFNNYDTFLNSLLLTFRVITFEGWNRVMRDTMLLPSSRCSSNISLNCGSNWSPLYFAVLVVFVGVVVVSLYAASLVEAYVTVLHMETSMARLGEIRRLVDIWETLDEEGSMMIPTSKLHAIFSRLPPPFGVRHHWDRTELTRLCREYHIPERGGRVHFHEVLLPIAKKALAWDLCDKLEDRGELLSAEAHLAALPTVRHRGASATAELHFAASFAAASYRRKRAIEDTHALRKAQWEEARSYCVAHGLPLEQHSFHGIAFQAPFMDQPPTPIFLRKELRETLKGKPLIDNARSVAGSSIPRKPPLSRPTSARPDDVAAAPTHEYGRSLPRQRTERVAPVTHPPTSNRPPSGNRGTSSDKMTQPPISAIREAPQRELRSVSAGTASRRATRSERLERKYSRVASVASASTSYREDPSSVLPLGTDPSQWRLWADGTPAPSSRPALSK